MYRTRKCYAHLRTDVLPLPVLSDADKQVKWLDGVTAREVYGDNALSASNFMALGALVYEATRIRNVPVATAADAAPSDATPSSHTTA